MLLRKINYILSFRPIHPVANIMKPYINQYFKSLKYNIDSKSNKDLIEIDNKMILKKSSKFFI